MSKIILTILIVAALGATAYFVLQPKKIVAPGNEVKNEQASIPQESGKKMAFSEFMKQGVSSQCTVNQEVNNTTIHGTVYLSGSSFRGEFSTDYNGTTMNVTTITHEGYAYTWTSAMPNRGYKIKVNPNTPPLNGSVSASGNYSFNADTIGDYHCEPWTPDDSKFTVPTTVTFTTVGN
jgi:hypothetical protein